MWFLRYFGIARQKGKVIRLTQKDLPVHLYAVPQKYSLRPHKDILQILIPERNCVDVVYDGEGNFSTTRYQGDTDGSMHELWKTQLRPNDGVLVLGISGTLIITRVHNQGTSKERVEMIYSPPGYVRR